MILTIPLSNILVIDIETVPQEREYRNMDERLQKQWDRKAKQISRSDDETPENLYFDWSAIYAEFGKIVTIAVGIYAHQGTGDMSLRVKSFTSDDEEKLLRDFKNMLETRFDQTTLFFCAHNGKEFDFPYICRRMLVNGIEIPEVLRIAGKKPWEVRHIDTMELWKFGDWKSYTSLELLATIFDIPSSKATLDGSKVNETYYHENDLDKIDYYCKMDVVVTAQLYLRLNNEPLIEEGLIEFIED